ncbi:AraC family transcriptional regulator [uncultured Tateyamaria sp.]|uniref:AraC family transcriptional regulator n=1 Tax=uncultured Tateyamaria sp. TaxID=455651 RepID=UPI00261C4D07|nr:AraC family transcriptional regulator [uncultured Tateyamaria sp.]
MSNSILGVPQNAALDAQREIRQQCRPVKFTATTASVDAKDRLDYWNWIQQPAFSLWPTDGRADGLNASLDWWHTGEVAFSDIRFRTDGKRPYVFELGRLNREVLAVRAFRHSNQIGLLGNEEVAFRSGEVHIYPFGREGRFITSHVDHVTAYIPFAMVGYDLSKSSEHIVFKSNSPVARILNATLCSTFDIIDDATASEARALCESFTGLVRSIIDKCHGGLSRREVFERARGAALRSFINDHLCDSDLTIDLICSAFGASRATVYREFEPVGGIARYVKRQRLQRAMLDLAMTAGARGVISEVARKYGFQETSSFTRAFRDQFGAAPSDYVGQVDGSRALQKEFNKGWLSQSATQIDSWFVSDR